MVLRRPVELAALYRKNEKTNQFVFLILTEDSFPFNLCFSEISFCRIRTASAKWLSFTVETGVSWFSQRDHNLHSEYIRSAFSV
jgi:hypothetical protein